MLPFIYGPINRSERKALLVAALCCLVFIALFAVVYPREKRIIKKSSVTLKVPTVVPPRELLEPERPVEDLGEPYRVAPENFKQVDFKNYSYGSYTYSDMKTLKLTLKDGELEVPDELSSFTLKDVYYKDVTGDGKAEAIVMLSHVQCGASCDGGSNLLFIYTVRGGKLKNLWKYETGSYAYGCALKSLTAAGREIVLELFGRCPTPAVEYPSSTKFLVADLTFKLWEFKDGHFSQKLIQYFDSSETNTKNYEPAIFFY